MDYDDLDETQRYFYMYLTAFSPSMEFLSQYVYYESQVRVISKTDYTKMIKQSQEVLAVTAASMGMTVGQYKKQRAEEMREDDLRKLKEKYNIRDEKDDGKTDDQLEADRIVDHYRNKMRAMKENPKIEKMIDGKTLKEMDELFDVEI